MKPSPLAKSLLPTLIVVCSCAHGPQAGTAPSFANARAGVDEFNRRMIDATLRMDDDALLALWEDDGVSLLPETKPLVGKAAIGAFIKGITSQLVGAKVRTFEMPCTGIEIAGDAATEYCEEHQVVDLGGGKPPFDGSGKLLYVLHRGIDRQWRLRRKMWNQGVKPAEH